MKCPVCNVDLMMADRQGVEIDYCPKCRGVWLDRGELDKIIERSMAYEEEEYNAPRREEYREDYPSRDYDKHGYPRKHRKKKSFFGDFFDFD